MIQEVFEQVKSAILSSSGQLKLIRTKCIEVFLVLMRLGASSPELEQALTSFLLQSHQQVLKEIGIFDWVKFVINTLKQANYFRQQLTEVVSDTLATWFDERLSSASDRSVSSSNSASDIEQSMRLICVVVGLTATCDQPHQDLLRIQGKTPIIQMRLSPNSSDE